MWCCDVYSDNVMCWLWECFWLKLWRKMWLSLEADNIMYLGWPLTVLPQLRLTPFIISGKEIIFLFTAFQFCLSFNACCKAFASCGFKVDASWKHMYIAPENTYKKIKLLIKIVYFRSYVCNKHTSLQFIWSKWIFRRDHCKIYTTQFMFTDIEKVSRWEATVTKSQPNTKAGERWLLLKVTKHQPL